MTITKYIGKEETVIIPSEIDGKSVTWISAEAFKDCNSLVSVSLPEGITYIENDLFWNCANLVNVSLPEGVVEIGSSAFWSCSSLENINIPDTARIVGNAFYGCGSLKSINIPEGTDNIARGAFWDCSSLESINIPESVVNIGESAFSGCSSLTSVNLPKGLKKLEKDVFSGCSGLESIILPEGLESIGWGVFYGCSSLRSIEIPENVAGIGWAAFQHCSGLEHITVAEGNETYDSRGGCNAVIETKSNKLEAGCKNTVIPKDVEIIACAAFRGSSLEEIVIPEGVSVIENQAFDNCRSLTSIRVAEENETYDSRGGCNAVIETETNRLVVGCKNTIIPESVKIIGMAAFHESSLERITIPEGVVSIEELAFQCCSSLKSIEIPSSVEEIADSALDTRSPDLVIYGERGSEAERYAKEHEIEFRVKQAEVLKADISKAVITLEEESYAYDGTEKEPAVTVWLDGKILVQDRDYTVSYSNNIKIGDAAAIVTGKGDYTGSQEIKFVIYAPGSTEFPVRTDISEATVTLEKTSYIYDGKEKTPAVTVKLGGKALTLHKDYIVVYSNNIVVGVATATVIGKDDYTGANTVNFMIVKVAQDQDVSIVCPKSVYKAVYGAKPFKINASSKSKLSFTSSNPKVAAVNKNTGKVTVKGTGIAVVTVKAGENSVKVTVKVSPKQAKIKSLQLPKGRKLTVKWAKDKNAAGYQIQISTAKNFKKNVKQKNITKVSCTFTKLKAGQKYYVRVRSYKKSGGETLYGAWSSKKQSGKVKK